MKEIPVQWQPIETAPKDGRIILAAYYDPKNSVYAAVRWSLLSEGWYSDESGHILKPTHWTTIIELPKGGMEREQNKLRDQIARSGA